ncbi:hypothetical protein AJ78_07367 [Emergomyces pasteurianus Ep9510]|uniref:Uncharacterized protein n=1 Tax=Emergomyces pasteurianus Ep9510 TaxID=1447872 RepID=A0A1J9P782_9EURO|nr:hypothetical protein AJ78_07367 [Emergomyces pasteurianus Ep9510]
MTNAQTVLDYLMVAPQGLTTEETNKTPNTTNDNYSWRDINNVSNWSEFTYVYVMQRYKNLLQSAQIASESMLISSSQSINIKLIQLSALQASFQHLAL